MKKKAKILLIVFAILGSLILYLHITDKDLIFKWSDQIEDLPERVTYSQISYLQVHAVAEKWITQQKVQGVECYLNGEPIDESLEIKDLIYGSGKYTLSAVYKDHSIEKTFELNLKKNSMDALDKLVQLQLPLPNDYKTYHDFDHDGITDVEELQKYGTNPYKEDTDGDGYTDGSEVILGLNPLKVDDQSLVRAYTVKAEGVSIDCDGYGNFIDIFLYNVDDSFLTKSGFNLSTPYWVILSSDFSQTYQPNTLQSAVIRFDIKEALEKESAENIGIYYYDELHNRIDWLESNLNLKSNEIYAPIYCSGKYGIGNFNKANVMSDPQVAIAIDNSASMFSKDYLIDQFPY